MELADREAAWEQLQREHAQLRSAVEGDTTKHGQWQHDLAERERILQQTEAEFTQRELALLAARTALRKEQAAFERRRENAARYNEGTLPSSLLAAHEGATAIDDTCISSPDFAKILTDAIESQDDDADAGRPRKG